MIRNYALYTTFNDNCLEIGMNMIYSFLFNNEWFDGDIVILCDHGEYAGLSENSRNEISKLYDKIIFKDDCYETYKDITKHVIEINGDKPTMLCYYKLELLKKDEYDVKVYIDADAIINKNIEEMFAKDNNIKNAICLDPGVYGESNFKISNMLMVRDIQKNDYFNAGVMIIKDQFIDNSFYQKCFDFCLNFDNNSFNNEYSSKGDLVDQDMFNELLRENVNILPFIYNTFAMIYIRLLRHYNKLKNIEYLNLIDKVKIIHYCGMHFKPCGPNIVNNPDFLKCFDIYYRYDYMRRNKNKLRFAYLK